MKEFEINGKSYRIEKLDAFKQFHVSRRIAPILPTLIPVFLKVMKDGGVGEDLLGLVEVIKPFTEGIAAMPDEAAEYVLRTCLATSQRLNGKTWAPVWSVGANACMYDDMDISEMMQIVIKVVEDSLGSFISGFLTGQQAKP